VSSVLGLLGILFFVACVIGLAAAVTWVVIRVSPGKRPADDKT
jgi:hypothetical protein